MQTNDEHQVPRGDVDGQLVADALAHVERMRQLAVSVISGMAASQDDNFRIFMIAQAVRSLRYFEAVQRLVASGIYEPAGAVLRVLLELVFVTKAVHADPGELAVLAKQSQGESVKSLRALARLPDDCRPTDLTKECIQDAIDEIGDQPGRFDAQYWASRSGLMGHYETMYRGLSVCSHGSLAAAADYVQIDGAGVVDGIRSDAASDSAALFLVDGASIMLEILGAVAEEPVPQDTRDRFTAMEREQRALRLRTAAILDVSDDH